MSVIPREIIFKKIVKKKIVKLKGNLRCIARIYKLSRIFTFEIFLLFFCPKLVGTQPSVCITLKNIRVVGALSGKAMFTVQ